MISADPAWMQSAGVAELQSALAQGTITSQQLVLFYLQRIAAHDQAGPRINSVLEVNPDAIQIASALDLERQQRGARGPLHGIPVLLKDNIDTGDKLHTSAGSRALANSYAPSDSTVASRLRQAGAIILGKANMTEWANFMTVGMKNGYSSRGGQVQNPYGPGKLDVGGSSSGSAAAVACSFAAVAVGTETSGSILSPASANSLVGIKPTVGLISRSGIIPISHSQDTAGPIAKTVADAATLLTALAGTDPSDPATYGSQGSQVDYRQYLDRDALRGARIGVPRSYYQRLDAERLAVMEQAIADLRSAGAVLVDPVEVQSAAGQWDSKVLVYEFKPNLNAYLGRLAPHLPVHSLRELIGFNQANAETMLKYGQTLLIESEATSGSLADAEYIASRLRDLQQSIDQGIDLVMEQQRLSALLFPGNWGAGIAARAGYPSITVPGGYAASGTPLGVTFTARAWAEPLLIGLAYAYEQATHHRVAPQLPASTE